MTIIYAKTAAVIGCVLVLLVALSVLYRLSEKTIRAWSRYEITVLWFSTRLAPIVGIYLLARLAPQSDVATCFWPQASAAAAGAIPYRDFPSFFGPLFPYLLATPLWVWSDPRALILWLSLLELAAIAATMNLAGLRQPGRLRSRFLLCAFMAPGPLLLSVIGGQEDFLLWGGGMIAWWMLIHMRSFLGGFSAGLALLSTKVLFVFPLLGFLPLARSPRRYLFAVLGSGGLALAVLWHLTGPAFLSVLGQSHNISPPQIWMLLHFVSGGWIPAGGPLVAYGSVIAVAVLAWMVSRRHATLLCTSFSSFAAYWILLYGMLMLLSAKSQGAYVGIFLLPALVQAIGNARLLAVWIALGALAAIEPSMFYRLGQPIPASLGEVLGWWGALDLMLQLGLVTFIAWFVRDAWHTLAQHRRAPVAG